MKRAARKAPAPTSPTGARPLSDFPARTERGLEVSAKAGRLHLRGYANEAGDLTVEFIVAPPGGGKETRVRLTGQSEFDAVVEFMGEMVQAHDDLTTKKPAGKR